MFSFGQIWSTKTKQKKMFNWFYLNENNCFPKYIDWFFAKFNWITFFMIVILDVQRRKKIQNFWNFLLNFFSMLCKFFNYHIWFFWPYIYFIDLQIFTVFVVDSILQKKHRNHLWSTILLPISYDDNDDFKSVCLFCLFINLPTWMIFCFLLVIIRWFSSYMIKEKHSTSASVLSRIFFFLKI